MTNAEVIAQIRAEIEKKYNESHEKKILAHGDKDYYNETAYGAEMGVCNRILSFLSTLEKQQFKVGDKVTINNGEGGIITRISAGKARVEMGDTMRIVPISSLESEKPIEGLEEEIKKEMVKSPLFIRGKDQIAFARHFAQWGAEHASGSSEIPNDLEEAAKKTYPNKEGDLCSLHATLQRAAFIAGAKWDREQMMREAVEGEIFDDYDKDTCEHHLTILSTVPSGYKDGDKVRVIVLPKED